MRKRLAIVLEGGNFSLKRRESEKKVEENNFKACSDQSLRIVHFSIKEDSPFSLGGKGASEE